MRVCDHVYVAVDLSADRLSIVAWNNSMRNPKTVKGYNLYQSAYLTFCRERKYDASGPCVEALCKFLISKFEEGKWTSASTFNQARSAVADLYRYTHSEKLGEDALVCATMKNISQKCVSATQKKPLTIEIMGTIYSQLKLTNREHIRNYYMMLLMVGAFLRESEVVSLEMKRVKMIKADASILACKPGDRLEIEHVPAKKRTNEYKRTLISAAPDQLWSCVVNWHTMYMSYVVTEQCHKDSQYLFHKVADGSKLADTTAWHAFHNLFTLAGLDYKQYGSQSARRGGATAAFEAGLSVEAVKAHGSWASSAVERYLKPKDQVLLATTSFLNTKPTQKSQHNA
jgi:site-specific recombinase XerD